MPTNPPATQETNVKSEKLRRVAEIIAEIESDNAKDVVYTLELSSSERWLLAYVIYSDMRNSTNRTFIETLRPVLNRLGGHEFLRRKEIAR